MELEELREGTEIPGMLLATGTGFLWERQGAFRFYMEQRVFLLCVGLRAV